MSTGSKFANITQKKILGYQDLYDRFMQYMQEIVHESLEKVWDLPAVHTEALALEADGANAFKITGSSSAADGQGRILKISDATVNEDISFENTNTVDYQVALKYADTPEEVDINPRTGLPEYRNWIEEIGVSGQPDLVTDNGNGTITFQVDSVTESGVNNAGRQVMVYKLVADKNATTVAVAVETCIVAWTSSENRIITTGTLGQSSVSEVVADYVVVLLGPVVKRYVDMKSLDGYVYIGTITGNGATPAVFDHTDQELADVTLSQIAQIAATADNDRLKIDIRPLAGEVGVDQIVVRDEDNRPVFEVDEVGKTTMSGFPTINTVNNVSKQHNRGTNPTHFSSSRQSRCLAHGYIDGYKKYFLFDLNSSNVETWDAETGVLENTDDLAALMPSTTHSVLSAFVDGKYIYIAYKFTVNQNAGVHCLDITNWSVKPGWASTGTTKNGITVGVDLTVGDVLLDIDEDKFVLMHPENELNPIFIISKLDGSTISSGNGDSPLTTQYAPLAIATDGINIFWSTRTYSGVGYICSCLISDPSSGSGISGFPKSSFNSGTDDPGKYLLAVDGCLITNKASTTTWIVWDIENDVERILIGTTALNIHAMTTDGVNVWAAGSRRTSEADEWKPAFFNFNFRGLLSPAYGDIFEFSGHEYDPSIENSFTNWVMCEKDDYGITPIDNSDLGTTFYFDGSDLVCVNPIDAGDGVGQIWRLTNILYRNGSAITTRKSEMSIAGSISSGSVTSSELDFKFGGTKYAEIDVDENITSFSPGVPNTIDTYFIRFTASGGSKTITGFSGYKWEGDSPPFTLSDGATRIMIVTYGFGASRWASMSAEYA